MLFLFIILLSIWFNNIWLVNNEMFILAVFLISFFLLIYVFMSNTIKIYFFSSISSILNLFKYSNMINIYLNKVLYYSIVIKNNFFKKFLKNKEKLINVFSFLNNKINNFLFFNILNFFLILKKNLFKILKNKRLVILKNRSKEWKLV